MSNPNVQVTPGAMTIIINIQGMRAMIYSEYDPIKDFQSLSSYDVETLREIQKAVLPVYNIKAKRNGKNSPLIKQVKKLKEHCCDALLLMRVGDYYESFYKDAEVVSQVCNTALIKRDEINITGFPSNSLDEYLPKLIKAGHKVAICH